MFQTLKLVRIQPLRIINKFKTNVRVATGADLQINLNTIVILEYKCSML